MDHRTDKQAALDDTGAWILKKLEKRFGEERLGLNTQEIGQVLDSMMGPAYDDKGTPTPQRQDPAEAARANNAMTSNLPLSNAARKTTGSGTQPASSMASTSSAYPSRAAKYMAPPT